MVKEGDLLGALLLLTFWGAGRFAILPGRAPGLGLGLGFALAGLTALKFSAPGGCPLPS